MPLKPRATAEPEARHARHLRDLNRARILTVAMDSSEPFTRSELTEATALSAPTVGTLTAGLIREGLLRDLGAGPSRGGRRPSFMEFNARHGFVLGIALGATRTRLAVADLRGERLAHRVLPTPSGLRPRALLARVAGWGRSLLEEAGVPRRRLLAAAASIPGAVDSERGVVVALAPNLDGWAKVPMGALLERGLGARVVVENDVNLAVLGERWRGVARGHDTCAFILVGSGIGAGVVVGGQLHRGHHFLAGEIGLMCMGPEYLGRDFGARGCLEALASVKAVAARWRKARGGQRDGWIEELMAAARSGDGAARKALDRTAALLGIAATNLSLVLDPSLIVLGGPLFGPEDGLVERVRAIAARIIPSPPRIVASSLGKEATLWGCLLVATTAAQDRLRRARPRRSG